MRTSDAVQDAEVFIKVDGEEQFVGEIYLYPRTERLVVCTPCADYLFSLTGIFPKIPRFTEDSIPTYNQPKLDSTSEPWIHQHMHGNFYLTYNPDDQKYYVTDRENNTLGRYKDFRNAVHKYKTLAGLIYKKGK